MHYPDHAAKWRTATRFVLGFIALTAFMVPWASHPAWVAPQIAAVYGTVVALGSGLTCAVLWGQDRRQRDIDVLGAAYLYAAVMAVLHLLTYPSALLPGTPALGRSDSAVGWLYQAWRIGFCGLLWMAARERLRGNASLSTLHARRRWILGVLLSCALFASVTLSPWMPPYFSAGPGRFSLPSYAGNAISITLAASTGLLIWRSRLWRMDPIYRWVGVVSVCLACSMAISAYGGGRYTLGWYVERIETATTSLLILGQVLQDFIRAYSENRFHRLADSTPALVWQANETGTTFLNDSYAKFAGCTKEQLLGAGWVSLLHPDDAPTYLGAFQTAMVTRSHFEAQARLRRHDGEYRWMHNMATPMLSSDGQFEGLVGSSADITEIKKTETELRAADERKDQFLATLAHELRNPLAPLRNGLSLLERSPSPDTQSRMLKIMDRQLTHFVRLIDDLLDVARVSSGRLSLRSEPVLLDALVKDVVEEFQPLFVAAKQALAVESDGVPLLVMGDADRLRQAIGNLLSNAMKYSEPGAKTRVALRMESGRAVVVVQDEGLGLPADFEMEAFEMFSSINRQLKRSHAGLGIGLALARQLVRLQEGDIVVQGAGLGHGTTFSLFLPLLEGHDQDDGDLSKSAPAVDEPLRILVVDDNEDAAVSLAERLRLDGHVVKAMFNPLEAVRGALSFKPDIAFLDLAMPGMNGHELLKQLRNEPALAQLPAVVLTGFGTQNDKALALSSGFDAHLTKPAAYEDLLAALSAARS